MGQLEKCLAQICIEFFAKGFEFFLGSMPSMVSCCNVQSGIISPSKLRMKLMGPHHNRKKDGSNSNSSRTSPSRLDDAEFVNNSLLASNDEEGWLY